MYFQEFIYTAAMVFFYFTAIIAQFADLHDFDSSEYLHRYDAQIVAGVSTLPDYFFSCMFYSMGRIMCKCFGSISQLETRPLIG